MLKQINILLITLILAFAIPSHEAWGKHFFPTPRKDLKYAEAIAGKTRTSPKIDGDLDDWQYAHFFAFDSEKELFRGKGSWKGKDDLSVLWAVMYDNDNFYFCAFVRDDIFAPGTAAQPWTGDTIFLYIDWNHTHAAIESKPNFALIGGKALVTDFSGGRNPLIAGDSKIAIVPNPDLGKGGMSYEVAIPIKDLTKVEIKEKVTIGFTPGYEEGTDNPEKKAGLVFMDWGGVDPDQANNLGHLAFGEELSVERQEKLSASWGEIKNEYR